MTQNAETQFTNQLSEITSVLDEVPETETEDEEFSEEEPIENESGGESEEGVGEEETSEEETEEEDDGSVDLESEEFYNIEVPLGDGLEPVTISELKDSYQAAKRLVSNANKIEEERVTLDHTRQALNQQVANFQQLSNMPAELVQEQAKMYAAAQAFQNINWEQEEQKNPGQAALRKQKLMQQHAEAQAAFQQKRAHVQQAMQQYTQQRQSEQQQLLVKAAPEWTNQQRYQNDRQVIDQLLVNRYNYSTQEAQGIQDHRALLLARDLVVALTKLQGIDTTSKQVVKKKKVIRQKAKVNQSAKRKKEIDAKINKAKQTRSQKDQITAVKELLG